VPSRDELGTNALLLNPPNVISPTFGPNSYESHLSVAARQTRDVKTIRISTISLDIDNPKDVEDFLSFPAESTSRDYLLGLKMIKRLQNLRSSK
jgi:2-phospho-L-lactate guanylyltransferase (CobY/MobA/RfbA family)